jgi:hypothetical protein
MSPATILLVLRLNILQDNLVRISQQSSEDRCEAAAWLAILVGASSFILELRVGLWIENHCVVRLKECCLVSFCSQSIITPALAGGTVEEIARSSLGRSTLSKRNLL